MFTNKKTMETSFLCSLLFQNSKLWKCLSPKPQISWQRNFQDILFRMKRSEIHRSKNFWTALYSTFKFTHFFWWASRSDRSELTINKISLSSSLLLLLLSISITQSVNNYIVGIYQLLDWVNTVKPVHSKHRQSQNKLSP